MSFASRMGFLSSGLGATLVGGTYDDLRIYPDNSTAGIKVDADGRVYQINGVTYTSRYTWLTGDGAASDYEVRWTSTSGTLSSGTEATWQGCGTDRVYYVRCTGAWSSETCTGTLEIRAASDGTILTSASVTLLAEVEP